MFSLIFQGMGFLSIFPINYFFDTPKCTFQLSIGCMVSQTAKDTCLREGRSLNHSRLERAARLPQFSKFEGDTSRSTRPSFLRGGSAMQYIPTTDRKPSANSLTFMATYSPRNYFVFSAHTVSNAKRDIYPSFVNHGSVTAMSDA